jgi:hypothetical protein
MNILEAMADPNVFAPHFKSSSWKPWKAALAAIFALPMDDEALAKRNGGHDHGPALKSRATSPRCPRR